ncbi:MAG: trigger factor [Propionibacteriaceae bacterium]|nr:trigger factor [Propionibacteriaceae bacterium]
MPSTFERLGPTRAKLVITIPWADLAPALQRVYHQIAGDLKIPGFRPGRVPPALIDQRVGRQAVLAQAVNEVLPDAYGAAVVEHKLAPLGQPEIELETLVDDQDAVFTAEVDIRPDFDLPDLAQVTVEVATAPPLEDEVDARVETLRQRFAETSPVERAAQSGDEVTINLVGYREGQKLDDAEVEDTTYVIGSGTMLEGLDEAVIGLAAGQQATFATTLLGGDHQDEPADVEVTVTQVSERRLPEVTDDWAQLVSSFDTVEEMRADLRQEAQRQIWLRLYDEARDKLTDALVEATAFELPEGLVARQVEDRTERVQQTLSQAGSSLAEYLANNGRGQTEDEFWAELAQSAEQGLRGQILWQRMAEDSAIPVTQEDLAQYVMARAQEQGTTPQDELTHMREHDHLGEWMNNIRRAKAINQALLRAKVVDAAGQPVDLSPLLTPPTPTATEDEPDEGLQIVDIA